MNYISSSEVHPRWVITKSSKAKRHAQTNQISSTSFRLLFTFYFYFYFLYFVALTSLSYLPILCASSVIALGLILLYIGNRLA